MLIVDGAVQFGTDYRTWLAENVLPQAKKLEVALQAEVAEGELDAEVNHNRWIVQCPDCLGATFVWVREDEPLQLCPNCWNGAVGYRVRKVRLPQAIERIEAVLKVRPLPQNRNWKPPETVEDLERENAEHGLVAALKGE